VVINRVSKVKQEYWARGILVVLIGAALLIPFAGNWLQTNTDDLPTLIIHARMPEKGGWSPNRIIIQAGEPLKLRLTSEDVIHGFAIGKMDEPSVEIEPGKVVEVNLMFNQPGTYTFYCTRWCGENHWRMRGVIEVVGEGTPLVEDQPLYLKLGLDIDAPHPAEEVPSNFVDPQQGSTFTSLLPSYALDKQTYRTSSPAKLWLRLRAEQALIELSDDEIWNIVAWIWEQQTSPESLAEAKQLYAENCAACHGETGKGNGVMVRDLMPSGTKGHSAGERTRPPDLTNPNYLFGASPALLEGKIIRGGMGTGMPYWGPVLTDEQIEALVSYIFQFAWVK
jgi:mono/diheme cytochrome c family protein/plastocyanin